MQDVIYLTQEGYDKKKAELDHLVRVRRPQVLERIKQCQDRGDLEEEGGDTEFQEAKREYAWVESRIEELRKVLAVSEVLPLAQIRVDRVGLGTVVDLRDIDTRKRRVCQICSALEADPAANRISAESPVGAALLDKTPGETVEVKTLAGVRRYKILKLSAEFPSRVAPKPVVAAAKREPKAPAPVAKAKALVAKPKAKAPAPVVKAKAPVAKPKARSGKARGAAAKPKAAVAKGRATGSRAKGAGRARTSTGKAKAAAVKARKKR
jgi:transcription elongation factor GreA